MNGTVRFTVPAVLAEVGPVVEVRDRNLRHVTQAQPGEPIELEAGLYLASVVLPTGGVDQQPVEVLAGSTVELQLGPHAAAEPFAAALAIDLPGERPPEWFARLRWADDGSPVTQGLADDLSFTAPAEGRERLIALQVAVPGRVPYTCMLPVLAGQTCQVRVVTGSGDVRATALPSGVTVTASIARYVAMGHLRLAAHAVANARGALTDPVGSALGAYALLRLGRLEEIEDVPALPDGAVIAAELAARTGRPGDAERWLREALERGTPMFADGLSLLATRVRPLWPEDARVARILDLATRADFAQVVVAYPGKEPVGAIDGWQRFT
jgi:hypothetical protein